MNLQQFKMKIVVLGAGISGLQLGRELNKNRKEFIILEKETEVGGLCRTMKTKKWRWDFGVHAMYSKNKEIMRYYRTLPLQYESRNRHAKICHQSKGKNYALGYPFENGLFNLPIDEKIDCLLGYIKVYNKRKKYKHLLEWINNGLGYGIAKCFMIPYSKKIWSCSLNEISMKLVNNRISLVPLKTIIESAFGEETVGKEYQAKFIYPKGGIGELTKTLAEPIRDKILLDAGVYKLIRDSNKWTIYYNGGYTTADLIVSTIPLIELLKMVDIKGLKNNYKELKYNDTYFIVVGLKTKFCDYQFCNWVYFDGNEIFYRLTFMDNFDTDFLPCVVAEVTVKGKQNENHIKKQVVKDLIKNKIINSEKDIGVVDIHKYKCTYPIPTIGMEKVLGKINSILRKNNILLLGRGGAWKYINMDHAIVEARAFYENKLCNMAY